MSNFSCRLNVFSTECQLSCRADDKRLHTVQLVTLTLTSSNHDLSPWSYVRASAGIRYGTGTNYEVTTSVAADETASAVLLLHISLLQTPTDIFSTEQHRAYELFTSAPASY